MSSWIFPDYVDLNGHNKISEWLREIPTLASVAFEALLDNLRPIPVLSRDTFTGRLHGECDGLYEFIVKAAKVQYRPLFFYGPNSSAREITILAGAIERGDKLYPADVCRTALRRYAEVSMDRRRVTKHVRIRKE